MNHSGRLHGGRPTSNSTSTTQQHLLARRKQINTLRIFNENVIETKQDVEFQMTFDVPGPLTLVMLIVLPRDFPNNRPLIKVIPHGQTTSTALQHPWINESHDVTGSPGLNSFRSSMTDLGRVVQAIKREFEKNPPQLTHSKPQKPTSEPVTRPASQPVPHASRSIPEIEELSKDQLETLQKDPMAFGVFYRKLEVTTMSSLDDQATALKTEIQSILDSSSSSLEAELDAKKQLFLERKQEYHSICQLSKDKAEQLKSTIQALDRVSLCDNLSIASHQDELESDKCAEAFLAGDMPLDDFLSDYVKKRTSYHIRKSKLERFALTD